MLPQKNTDEHGSAQPTNSEQTAPAEEHLGAVEGDRPSDRPQQGNRNADALDEQGMPDDPVKIAEDVIGANEDKTTG
jgi:hypothetical protein